MEKENSVVSLEIEKALSDKIISDYVSEIRTKLLNGEEVYVEGIGKLVPSFRRVKNDRGRNYSLGVKVIKDKKFSKEMITAYNKDRDKFIKK